MTEQWYHMVTEIHQKDTLIEYLQNHPEEFDGTVKLGYDTKDPKAWRACWIIFHCMHKNDDRVRPHLYGMIKALGQLKDGHQRELMKVLNKMTLDDDLEGRLFDVAMNMWESVKKQPSVRHTALKIILRVIKKYPELWTDLKYVLGDEYLESLSPGIRHILEREIKELESKLSPDSY